MRASFVRQVALDCGFDLAGIAAAAPPADAERYLDWVRRGLAGEMAYLTDHRAQKRADPRSLLPTARSVLCVAKLYNSASPAAETALISRYAWGEDYHGILRQGLERVVAEIKRLAAFDFKICVDTAPLLERSFARLAGLGWIGRNTCLINERWGSWLFLGGLLLSLDLEPDSPPPGRCGTCSRCIEACPTRAIVPTEAADRCEVDSRLCISYLTIELRGTIPEELRSGIGTRIFGCDICQEVCPWNVRFATETTEPAYRPAGSWPMLAEIVELDESAFEARFGHTALERARCAGLQRNARVVQENARPS